MLEFISNPWEVAEIDFPAQGSPGEQLRFLLNYAVLAPSRLNTQPWLFRVDGHTVELHADRSKRLPAVDADDRELTIGCGAALENLLVAMHYFGYAPNVEIDSHPDQADLLARISLDRGGEATEGERLLFQAIRNRRTNRRLFKDRKVAAPLLQAIEEIARQQGTSFQVVSEELRPAVVNLIAVADRLLWEKPGYRQELAAWVNRDQGASREGVPENALGGEDLASSLGPPVLRTLIQEHEESVRHVSPGSPVLALISTFADSWFDWLAAGRTLERILLRARAGGVWASFFNQPIEVASSRAELRDLLGRKGFPQLVLRMGYGPEVPPTPRQGVKERLLRS
jgi:signal recognition particle subunit SEC65